MLAFLLALACTGGAPSTPPAPEIAAVPPPPAAPTPVVNTAALDCCDNPESTAIVKAYADLNAALAADKDGDSELTALTAAIHTDADLAPVADKLAMLAGKPIADKRTGLKGVSTDLLGYVHGHAGGDMKVREAFCPMFDAGWIQTGDTIANPYYGSQMLTCGSFR